MKSDTCTLIMETSIRRKVSYSKHTVVDIFVKIKEIYIMSWENSRKLETNRHTTTHGWSYSNKAITVTVVYDTCDRKQTRN